MASSPKRVISRKLQVEPKMETSALGSGLGPLAVTSIEMLGRGDGGYLWRDQIEPQRPAWLCLLARFVSRHLGSLLEPAVTDLGDGRTRALISPWRSPHAEMRPCK